MLHSVLQNFCIQARHRAYMISSYHHPYPDNTLSNISFYHYSQFTTSLQSVLLKNQVSMTVDVSMLIPSKHISINRIEEDTCL